MKKFTVAFMLLIWVCAPGCRSVGTEASDKPLIGITTVYDEKDHVNTVSVTYVDAVLANGGIPLILPTIDSEEALDRYVEELDGLVLTGGRDIPPSMYGQTPHETVEVLPDRRTRFDSALIARWMASGKPILGICLGMQFTNVVMGGSMIQDIPSMVGAEVNHRKVYHRVEITPDSRLAQILGAETAMVYSSHHQAVDRIGRGLTPVAHADDGIVEALERTDGDPGLFVQWHPEAMADKHPEHTNAIFGYLIEQACLGKRTAHKGLRLSQE
jgi:putative glutamine amidotransferase